MIQLAAQHTTTNTAASTIANAGAPPAGQAGNAADQTATPPVSVDFASLLTVAPTVAKSPVATDVDAAVQAAPSEPTPIGARAMLQQLAVALQQGGKTLPVAGKLAADSPDAAAQPATDAAETDAEHADAATTGLENVIIPTDGVTLPVPAAVLAAGAAVPSAPTTSSSPSQGAAHRSDGAQGGTPSVGHAVLPALIEAQPHGRPLTLAAVPGQPDQVTVVANEAAAAEVRTITVSHNGAVPAQAFTLNPGAAPDQPGAVHLRPVLAAKAMMTKAAASEVAPGQTDPATAASAMALPQIATPAMAGAPAAAPLTAGHDFATLVDRLIEARDAASPQGIHVAMDHAEFGKVSLSFHQDAAGLSVSVASPDPDFARAVQAAAPATGADGMSGQNQSDARGASAQADLRQQFSGTSTQSQGGGQGRSPSTDPRSDRVAANSGAADAAALPEAARRRGLFA